MLYRQSIVVLFLLGVVSMPLWTQDDSVDLVKVDTAVVVDAEPEAVLPVSPVWVEISNRQVVGLRATVGGSSAETRAEATTARIQQILDQTREGVVEQRDLLGGKALFVDDRLAVLLVAEDIDTINGESMSDALATAKTAIETLIKESHELESVGSIVETLAMAGGALVVFLLVLRGLWWLRKKLEAQLLKKVTKTATESRTLRQIFFSSNTIPLILSRVVRAATWVVTLVLTYVWLTFTLRLFPYTRAWGEEMKESIFHLLRWFLDNILDAIPDLIIVVLIFLIARAISKFISNLLERIERGTLKLSWIDAESVRPTRHIVRIVIWMLAFAFAYPYIPGSGTDAFKGVSVVAGLMLSLGASSSVGQALSGLILMYSRTIRVGEFVQIDDHVGTVARIGFFQTWLRTPFHEEISMPSSKIVSSTIVNHTRLLKNGLSFSTNMTIGYDTPWRQVHEMLKEAASRTSGVTQEPPPIITQGALQDFYVQYKLSVVFADPKKRHETITELLGNIQDVFNENSVQIMSPHYVSDPTTPKVVPPGKPPNS